MGIVLRVSLSCRAQCVYSALSMRVFGKDITSPVKEKEKPAEEGPVVVSAEDVEDYNEDAADENVPAADVVMVDA